MATSATSTRGGSPADEERAAAVRRTALHCRLLRAAQRLLESIKTNGEADAGSVLALKFEVRQSQSVLPLRERIS